MDFFDRCTKDVPLSTISTFGIGGPAQWFFQALRTEDLQEALRFVSQERCPFLIIGKGSNCLFPDEGFPGIIIQNRIDIFVERGDGVFEVGGGYPFPMLGLKTVREGWGGLEFAVGIPGSAGGAVFMNAGAHKQQTADTVAWVDYVDESGSIVRLLRDELSFAYRHSSLQTRKGAVARVGFQLKKDEEAKIRQQEMVDYRKKTQPYQDRSAGCVFRNPPGMSAGSLIEQSGLKGKRIGGAEVSPVHANFIVNREGASAEDVLKLVNYVRQVVAETKGVWLESEIRMIQPRMM
jgi:UDP-N-acetylmuramate dehydrogenase